MPDNLIESELFGHEKGAFTDAKASKPGRFELAGAGTLFLDEVSELSLHLQSKLLRVLQEREFERVGGVRPIRLRARLVTATNKDLEAEVRGERFREDLFHRLNLARIVLPPLRERREDIEPLARYFLARANAELGTTVPGIGAKGLTTLHAHDWPGNVRELEHAIKRGVMAARTRPLGPDDMQIGGWKPEGPGAAMHDPGLRDAVRRRMAGLSDTDGSDPGLLPSVVAEVENELIRTALEQTGGNQVAASRLLGISRTTLRARLNASRDTDSDRD
jgi:DNA-binding NtrC family response regulator